MVMLENRFEDIRSNEYFLLGIFYTSLSVRDFFVNCWEIKLQK